MVPRNATHAVGPFIKNTGPPAFIDHVKIRRSPSTRSTPACLILREPLLPELSMFCSHCRCASLPTGRLPGQHFFRAGRRWVALEHPLCDRHYSHDALACPPACNLIVFWLTYPVASTPSPPVRERPPGPCSPGVRVGRCPRAVPGGCLYSCGRVRVGQCLGGLAPPEYVGAHLRT